MVLCFDGRPVDREKCFNIVNIKLSSLENIVCNTIMFHIVVSFLITQTCTF